MQTIVIAYDDTPTSERALERALEVARAFDSKLVVTSVAPVVVSGTRGGAVDLVDSPEKHRADF